MAKTVTITQKTLDFILLSTLQPFSSFTNDALKDGLVDLEENLGYKEDFSKGGFSKTYTIYLEALVKLGIEADDLDNIFNEISENLEHMLDKDIL